MKTMKNLTQALVGSVALLLAPVAFAENVNLGSNENSASQVVAAKLLTEIYKKAGLTLNVTPMPGARANAMALAGQKDGEVARVPAYFVKNTTLIKVEPAYYYLSSAAFAKSERGVTITSKDDLKKYKVGIVRGVAHAESATEGLAGLQVANSADQMYQMLDAGRIDVAIDEGINGPITLKRLGLKGIAQVGEIARLDLSHVLVPAKKDMAPKISAAIKALKDSGELAKQTKRYEDELTK